MESSKYQEINLLFDKIYRKFRNPKKNDWELNEKDSEPNTKDRELNTKDWELNTKYCELN